MRTLIIFLLAILSSCSSEDTHSDLVLLRGRESARPIYRAEPPPHWTALPESASIKDSREPIASWKSGEVLIVFHNFPGDIKIDPMQQVARWKKQITSIEHEELFRVSHGGFGGVSFEAYNQDKGMIAFAFKLNDLLYQKLTQQNKVEERADWTLKATGPKDALREIEPELTRFVDSIELIEPIR
jgi:hypothetical protein